MYVFMIEIININTHLTIIISIIIKKNINVLLKHVVKFKRTDNYMVIVIILIKRN
jgi:hypothetical protein